MDDSSFSIREAKLSDLPIMLEMDKQIFGVYGGDEEPEVIAARLDIFIEGCALMVSEDGRIAGYLTTEKWDEVREPSLNEDPSKTHRPNGTVLNITTLAITPEFQNQRLGGKLLSYAEQFAIEQGCSDVVLETARAKRFYERHGYQLMGEREQQGVYLYVLHRNLS